MTRATLFISTSVSSEQSPPFGEVGVWFLGIDQPSLHLLRSLPAHTGTWGDRELATGGGIIRRWSVVSLQGLLVATVC